MSKMETVDYDSELMTQYLAAKAVPNSRRFVAVRDSNGHLVLFSLGTDEKLYVSTLQASGNRVVQDFGHMLGLSPNYTAHAFEVTQDAASTLYVAVATAHETNKQESSLYLLRPFKPNEVDLSSKETSLKSFIMPETGSGSHARVYSFFMAPSSAEESYPPVLFAFQTEIHRSQDLASALVTHSSGTWSWTREDNVKVPENASEIMSVQPLVMKYGNKTVPGYASLYKIQGKMALVFHSVNASHKLDIELTCPAGAATLAAVINEDGVTDLLVGGSGLHRFKAAELTNPQSYEVSNAGVFSSISEIQISQSELNVSIWAANSKNGIGYLMTDIGFVSPQAPVQLIPDEQGGYFSCFKATSTDCEKFVVSDQHGNLTLLEQDAKSGIWKTVPIVQPNLETNIAIQSYVTQIKPLDANHAPLIAHPLILRASGEVSILVNGRAVLATEAGVTVSTDQSGLLTLTVPTEDISTHTFSVSDSVSQANAAKTLPVDPSRKINQKLSKVSKGEDLDVTLSDGTKLLAGTKLSPTDIDQAAKTISAVMNRRNDIVDGKSTPSRPLQTCYGFNAEALVQQAQSGIIDMVWAAWHWIEKMAEKFISFVIQGADVLIQIGATVYRWVMETVDEVGKVLSVLFDKVLQIGKKIIQWLGFIFNWNDIQATKESIVNIATDALDKGPELLGTLKDKVDKFFQDLEKEVSGKRPKSEDLKDFVADEKTGTKDSSMNLAGNSVAANWSQYQFVHGGARDASTFIQTFGDSVTRDDVAADGEGKFENELTKLKNQFEGKVEPLQNKLVREYDPKGKKSIGSDSAMEKIGTSILVEFIKGIRSLADLTLESGQTIIQRFRSIIIDQHINVPVFSSLYKEFISPGHDLTILDALALIIAIPATILSKLVTNETLPKMPRGKFNSILDKMVKGKSVEDADFRKFAAITGASTFGVLLLISIPASFVTDSRSQYSAGTGQSGLPMEMPSITSPLVTLAHSAAMAGAKGVTFEHFTDAGSFFYQLFSIPTADTPGQTLRIIGWVLSVFNCTVDIALHFVTALSGATVDTVRAVIDAIFQALIFGFSVAASAEDIRKGKDDIASGLDIANDTFMFLAAWAGALERLTEKTQPEVAMYASVVKYGSYVLAGIMTGTKVSIHVAKGNYVELPLLGDL